MGRAPCCDKANVKRGPWSPEEDAKLKEYIEKFGTGGNWIALPQKAGLKRCGKSCRLRWLNYLRPNIKHGEFSDEEDRIICSLYANIGSRWSIIAAQLPGRTDNDIKNYWNTKLKKKLMALASPLPQQHHFNHNSNNYNRRTPSSNPHNIFNQPSASALLSEAISFSSPYNNYYYTPTPPPLLSSPSPSATSTTTLSFGDGVTGFDQTSNISAASAISATLLGNSPTSTVFQQDGGYLSSNMQNYLMFGGGASTAGAAAVHRASEPSCSSSDGSCNQINQDDHPQFGNNGSNVQQKQQDEEAINGILKKYFYNLYNDQSEEDQKILQDYNSTSNDHNNGANVDAANGLAEKCSTASNSSSMFLEDVPPLTLNNSLDFGLEEIKQLICSSNSFLLDENKTTAAAAAPTVAEERGVMMYY